MTATIWNPLESQWDAPLTPALLNITKGCNGGPLVYNWQREHFTAQIFDCAPPVVVADLGGTDWTEPLTYPVPSLTGTPTANFMATGGGYSSNGGFEGYATIMGASSTWVPPHEAPAPVPLPASGVLLAMALVALVKWRVS